MLRDDPPTVHLDGPTECLVAEDGSITLRCADQLTRITLETATIPVEFRVPNQYESPQIDQSDRVRAVLKSIHERSRIQRLEFAARGGLGFRTIQAKRAGLDFDDVLISVRLDGCSRLEREQSERWPSGFEEIELDYVERYAFENADERIIPDDRVLMDVERIGWITRENRSPDRDPQPLVTIAIAHHNLGDFLPETLASIAAQTYHHLDVIVIDDGSTDSHSLSIFQQMRDRYPQFRFMRQTNLGIGATRNRCLELARGQFFIPVDADNIARPDMVERFVHAIQRNPHLAAMTCYFLAFADTTPGQLPDQFMFANRPTGGPHPLACLRNVYGDANAIMRTETLRSIGGYEIDRGTSCEDWELFVKLVHAGHEIGVVPDHLFYYRHRPAGFSRRTNWFINHHRVLRQFTRGGVIHPRDADVLWTAFLGFHLRLHNLEHAPKPRRYQIADRLYAIITTLPRMLKRFMNRFTHGRGRPGECRVSP